MTNKLLSFLRKTAFMACAFAASQLSAQTSYDVPIAGNAYITSHEAGVHVTDHGIKGWTSPETVVSTYFYVDRPQTVTLALRGEGHATLCMTCMDAKQTVRFDSDRQQTVGSLEVSVSHPGYVKVDLQGVEREGDGFANVSDVVVTMGEGKLTCVNDFSSYWGRRGPSVHMAYRLPEGEDYEWFYNEVTVPADGETMCSYYMVAGFGEGYFGMQYNSPTERRVLFSVWSPFDTQDPRNIPEDMRVKLLRKGRDVQIGEFGNEGSGGQSFLRYPWKAGQTYAFLMRVHPDGRGNTIYTAYFRPSTAAAKGEGEWRLIAEFQRPKTNTWYTRPHSFLENFMPEQGYLSRNVRFTNQWARTRTGKWVRPEGAVFTHDATAAAGVRLDYAGGISPDGEALFLRMGGFFDQRVKGGTRFPLPSYVGMTAPKVNFKKLLRM